jgi:hypothetical protein
MKEENSSLTADTRPFPRLNIRDRDTKTKKGKKGFT